MNEEELLRRITTEPGKVGGKPCIRGHRFKVTDLLDLVACGLSFEEINDDFPFIEPEDIHAAALYASRFLRTHGASDAAA